jgi:streptogramin lyase
MKTTKRRPTSRRASHVRRLLSEALEDRCLLAGSITEYTGLAAKAAPVSIAAGADGALWFTEPGSNKIGRMTTSGGLTEYAIPTSGSLAAGIAAGADGALWFTEPGINKIGRVTTSGSFTQYAIPSAVSLAASIAPGPDGNLWFTEPGTNKIGRVTTAGNFTEYAIPTAKSRAAGIAPGPDGNLWFTEPGTNKIARATSGLTTTSLASSANPSVLGQGVTLTATVTANTPEPNTPTGTVSFKDGSSVLGTGTLNGSGQATLTVSNLVVGAHTITATYGGDSNFVTSTSTPLSQQVGKDVTTTALVVDINP